ncbi:MAG: hypothetical protein M3314_02500 [Actinomycetota bacterium]|nr:hypothetical protein [Actinomycetota bacterium]
MPRHELDLVSLVSGLAFAGAAVVFLLDAGTAVSGRWAWPVLLIVLGVVGLFASQRRRDDV